MTRKKQNWMPDVIYHCQSRCLEERNLLAESWIQKIAADVVDRARAKYNFELVNVEFPGNHLNITIRTVEGSENISPALQYIKARIAEKYNRETKKIGPFWNGRSKYRILGDCENPEYSFVNRAFCMNDSSINSGLAGIPGV